MTKNNIIFKIVISILFISLISCKEQELNLPHPENNPSSPLMLEGEWVPDNPHKIDFNNLPRIKSQHTVVSDVRAKNGVNQHNYLVFHNGRYWVMWSDGPGVEDRVGQRVAFATSADGLNWSDPKFITPYPPNSGTNSPFYNTRSDKGFRYISRGFWQRGEELLALVSLDEADKFFGSGLELRAFRLNPKDDSWEDIGVVYDNTINNFPPKRLPNGEWMMTRRSYDRDVYMLTGGIKGFDQWETHPVVSVGESALLPEEPYWWVLPDGNLLALFRDNARSGYLFRAFSSDNGRTWSRPVRTDFPDARSKFNGLQMSDGRYILVSNPNPKMRDPLALSISEDGLVFKKMGYLIGGRSVDYPHVIEHNGYLLIAFSGGKQSVEVLKIKISELDDFAMPTILLQDKPHVFVDKTKVEFTNWKNSKEIRYTTNGSIPTIKSTLYTKPFNISETTVIKLIEVFSNEKISSVYVINYIKQLPIEPVSVERNNEGLKFQYYKLDVPINMTNDLMKMRPSANGIIQKIIFPYENEKLHENFGLIFNGYIEIYEEDIYTFSVLSNDGSCLFIADNLVVDHDGQHGTYEKEGQLALQAGFHKIELLYFQSGGEKALKVFMKRNGSDKIEIARSILSY